MPEYPTAPIARSVRCSSNSTLCACHTAASSPSFLLCTHEHVASPAARKYSCVSQSSLTTLSPKQFFPVLLSIGKLHFPVPPCSIQSVRYDSSRRNAEDRHPEFSTRTPVRPDHASHLRGPTNRRGTCPCGARTLRGCVSARRHAVFREGPARADSACGIGGGPRLVAALRRDYPKGMRRV